MKNRILAIMLTVIFVLSGCAEKNSKEIVAYVSETPITAAEISFYLDNVKQQMQGTELSNDDDWNNMVIDGRKAIEIAKEQALEIASVNIAYIKIYEAMGKSFSGEANEKIEKIKTETISQYDDDGYEKFLADNGISDEFITMLCRSTYCSDVLYREFLEENKPKDGEATAQFDAYIREKMKEYNIVAAETKEMANIK